MNAFNSLLEDATSPAREWFSITPHNRNNLSRPVRSIWVNGAGNVAVVAQNGDEAIFAVSAGMLLPVQPVRVKATGTTATGLIGLY